MRKGKHLVPRMMSPDPVDLPALESWLSALSAKGLHYRRSGKLFFLWFERGEKKAVRYRLDVISPVSSVPDREKREQAREMGWDYVGRQGAYAVYACEDPTAPELHTDPVTQSYTMDEMARKYKRMLPLAVLLPLVSAALLVFNFTVSDWPLLAFVTSGNFSVLFSQGLMLFIEYNLLAQIVRFLRLRRQLRDGLPMEHAVNYRLQAGVNLGVLALATLFAVVSFYTAFRSISGREEWNITAQRPSPFDFHLAQIEDRPELRATHFLIRDRDMDNNVQVEWSLLAPEQYDITERGEVPGKLWPDGSGDYRPSMTVNYYRLTIPALADGVMDDLIYRHTEYNRFEEETYIWTELAYPGIDEALLAQPEDGSSSAELFVRTGGQVVYLRYHGVADLAAVLPELAAALGV